MHTLYMSTTQANHKTSLTKQLVIDESMLTLSTKNYQISPCLSKLQLAKVG